MINKKKHFCSAALKRCFTESLPWTLHQTMVPKLAIFSSLVEIKVKCKKVKILAPRFHTFVITWHVHQISVHQIGVHQIGVHQISLHQISAELGRSCRSVAAALVKALHILSLDTAKLLTMATIYPHLSVKISLPWQSYADCISIYDRQGMQIIVKRNREQIVYTILYSLFSL